MIVSFVRTKGVASVESPGIDGVRATETVAAGGTSVESVQDGEVVVVANNDADMVKVAFGTVPNAALAAETGASTAGLPVPAGAYGIVLTPDVGHKIAVAAL
jgi:hypothetical protein